ncbi:family 65 glycosyl hydrolase [Vagococcus sp. BWB3-3]|uniref:Family 65 glycosyl hydrolase n=1 Tax=Vagococcus allomyrinae TaxID=2794353 RepID=A0A940PFJ7_9ENTE|nr:glycosyl hydrolase family 65 protein [Vagococcus allomyrinae]MBP1041918.1 family 65 glycosyl hydrolase [Vagococcus allomyrinae]
MAKIADLYYQVSPWKVSEVGFDSSRNEVSESIFSLGNEYLGVRGYFEEGYGSASLLGSYFNGVYENSVKEHEAQYKGIIKRSHFMVNAVDWLSTKIELEGERLDLADANITEFYRELDFKTGQLKRSFVWTTLGGKRIKISLVRFLHMESVYYSYQKLEFEALNFQGEIQVELGLDFATIHQSEMSNFWTEEIKEATASGGAIIGKTLTTQQQIFSGFEIKTSAALSSEIIERDKFIGRKLNVKLEEGKTVYIHKYITNIVDKQQTDLDLLWQRGLKSLEDQLAEGYDNAVTLQKSYWSDVWQKYDIEIAGDDLNQQGIRYCIFQMQQTYHGQNPENNIGAKGLTGEAYGGHAFWDTETSCLPFYLLTNLKAARNLLEFRYATLEQARQRAKELDCQGACYPIATLNGNEASALWQHASLQFQPSTGVAYGIWHYVNVSQDQAFVFEHGVEMLIEISRFLASRGDWSPKGQFGFYGVMGPDEFQMMVNHNAYTNYMAKKTFEYTLEVVNQIKQTAPERYRSLQKELALSDEEQQNWQNCAENTLLIVDEAGLIEQHDGFFDLPHVAINEIPVEEFPLYNHWSYDRIYRNDMIKQPDVLMFQFLHNQDFSDQSKKVNYEFYEPKTIHESSLSPSVHSILAAELGKKEEAYDFFGFATRMDLDNYNRNTREGLHTTSIAAAWMNIVYGFGGVRTDGDRLVMAPMIPPKWQSYRFTITYQDQLIEVLVGQESSQFRVIDGKDVLIKLYGKDYHVNQTTLELPMI